MTEHRWPVDQRDPPYLLIEHGVQVRVHFRDELIDRRVLRVSRYDRAPVRVGLRLVVHGAEQRLLVGKVVVHRTRGDPGRGRDLVDRGLRVALRAEQGTGGGEHSPAGGLGVLRAERGRRLGAAFAFR